jgi:ATP-dependent Clp protease adaptor protein ClpS
MRHQTESPRLKKLFYFCNIMLFASTHTKTDEKTDVLTDFEEPCHLILWNDEVNTFEWVIATLMEVCNHSEEQAEQCAWLIHTKGKYAVKNGSYDELKPYCDSITERGIGATIEVAV